MPTSAPTPTPVPTPAPASATVSMPAPAVTVDGVEQLPRYEPPPPPPPYERIPKAGEQQPVEMRDLERGEPSGAAASRGRDPPGYQAAEDISGSDERVSIRRVDTDGSHVGEPPPPVVPTMLFVRGGLGRVGPFPR